MCACAVACVSVDQCNADFKQTPFQTEMLLLINTTAGNRKQWPQNNPQNVFLDDTSTSALHICKSQSHKLVSAKYTGQTSARVQSVQER